jgi:tRNA threonylcarbamoyl adenosine modification protein YeaZ
MRPVLALETSGKYVGVAVRAESGLLFSENVTAGAAHGRALAPLMSKALNACSLRPGELEAVAVSLGPGSWTGLRIGLSAAKAFAWGARIGILGVPSFEALAQEASAHAPNQALLTVRDARMSGYFCALFGPQEIIANSSEIETSSCFQRWIPECVLSQDEMLSAMDAAMREHAGTPLAVCGDEVCLNALEALSAARGWTLLRGCEHISAAALAECGWRRLRNGNGGEGLRDAAAIHKLAPLYLRASSPEVKLQEAQRRASEAGAPTVPSVPATGA